MNTPVMTRSFVFLVTIFISLGLFVAPHAHAKRCEGVTMQDEIEVDGQTLLLNGMGIREATVFSVNVFIAGLYVAETTNDGAAIIADEGLRRIALRFVRSVPTDRMAGGLEESFGSGLAPQVARFVSLLPVQIEEGTVILLTYRAGAGMEVIVDGRVRGAVRGRRFARAFFRYLIGPNPPNRGLKVGLLGGHCG